MARLLGLMIMMFSGAAMSNQLQAGAIVPFSALTVESHVLVPLSTIPSETQSPVPVRGLASSSDNADPSVVMGMPDPNLQFDSGVSASGLVSPNSVAQLGGAVPYKPGSNGEFRSLANVPEAPGVGAAGNIPSGLVDDGDQ